MAGRSATACDSPISSSLRLVFVAVKVQEAKRDDKVSIKLLEGLAMCLI